MRVALVGSRTIPVNPHACAHIIKSLWPGVTHIVSGGCNQGADAQAHLVAALIGVEYVEFPAQWKRPDGSVNRAAGFERNTTIVENCDEVLCYWDGISRGADDTVRKARKAGKGTFVITPTKGTF